MSVIITLGNTANTATVNAVDTLISGSGGDTIALTGLIANGSVDLGGGADTLTFGNFANTATVANTETITGGSANDTLTLAGAALTTAMAVDLAAGANKLSLANLANTGSVSNVQTLTLQPLILRPPLWPVSARSHGRSRISRCHSLRQSDTVVEGACPYAARMWNSEAQLPSRDRQQ